MSEDRNSSGKKNGHVMSYLVILFAAAFLLMLLSYFIQRRSNEETINTLQFSVSSLQSVDDLVAANEALYGQVSEQQQEIFDLEQEKSALEGQLEEITLLENQVAAMDWLWRIQRSYSRWEIPDCMSLVEAFEASGLTSYLPSTSPSGADGATPAQQYTALLDALDYLDEP